MKHFKPIVCPVCDGFFFSEPNEDDYAQELKAYLDGEVYCSHCGWIYDLNQAENPDSANGYNKMSVNDLKRLFAEKIKENPDYDYFEEHKPAPIPHLCPVCGEYEFKNVDSYDICPICGWEDEDYFEGGGANELSLEDAKKLFLQKRSSNPKFKWIRDKK